MNDTPLTGASTWTLGTLIAFPLFTVITLALLIVGGIWLRAGIRGRKRGDYDYDDDASMFWPGIGVTILAVVVGASTALAMWPYDAEYHKVWTVHGTVTSVSSRMIADGKAMSERYVVEVAGHPFGIDDTRASLLKPGDTVTLGCTREWQYAAESGWACRWQGVSR